MSELKDCLELLEKMVAIPSESGNEEAHARFVESWLREELHMETELQHVEGKSYNVVGRWPRPGASRRLILGGHLDTVPPTSRWTTNPYELVRRGDELHGLGAGDMKGGLAAQMTVLRRLLREGREPDAEIHFVGVSDEERLSVGANYYAAREKEKGPSGQKPFFVMGEPHFDNIVIGATGKVLLKLVCIGAAGHAATPEKGINAIDCMAKLLTALRERYTPLYEAGRCGSLCCLKIENPYPGYSLNIPEECSCLLNKQLSAGESLEQFLEELQELYRERVGRGELRVSREIPSYPSYTLPAELEEITELTAHLRESFGREPVLRINQSVSDGNILYNELGIPTVLFGPRGVAFHTEGEYLSISSVESYLEELYTYICKVYNA